MFGLLPFLFALVIASTAQEVAPSALPGSRALVGFFAASVGVWMVVCFAASRWIGRRHRHSLLAQWDLLAQGAVLGWFAALCYRWKWPAVAPGLTASLVPFTAMLIVHWWTLADAVRGVTGHRWSRWALVLHHLRLSAMPLILVLVLFTDAGDWFMRHVSLDALIGVPPQLIEAVGMEALMLGTLILMPPLLVRLWGAVPMPPGPKREALARACADMGIRVHNLMRWPIRGGRMYNAAVVGSVARLRYVLFTDDLASDLPPDQVRAVLGHELGHVRHGHLWLYFVFSNIAMATSLLVVDDVRAAIDTLPGADHLAPEVRLGLAHVLVLAFLFRLAFGWLSRACERQADLAGAELVGDARIMQDALKSVARLSGQPEDAGNWRHHTIAERVAFLERVRARPELAADHHRRVARMRLSLVFLLAALAALLATSLFFNPLASNAVDARKELAELADEDPDLRDALRDADGGEIVPLVTWLTRADELTRARFAAAQLAALEPPKNADFDDRTLYPVRHRLRALANVSLGGVALDGLPAETAIANTLAYALVAGTTTPTKADLDQARALLPTLETAVEHDHEDALLDTIGCVLYRLGDFAHAHDRFAEAVRLAEGRRASPPSGSREDVDLWRRRMEQGLALYQRRLAACDRALAAAAEGRATEPLPLAWTTDPAPTPEAAQPTQPVVPAPPQPVGSP